jgi:hypothetical protein
MSELIAPTLIQFDAVAIGVSKRSDTVQGLPAAHAELSHGEWAQQKVQAARAGVANGSNRLITPEEWAAIRTEKERQRNAL